MSERAQHLPADERRAATVEAVVALAGEQNPSDITTSAIAERMGLTQGALFRHFPTKDAIVQAVMSWVTDRMLARIARAIEGHPSPIAALKAIFDTHIKFVMQHPGVPRVIFGQLQQPGNTVAKQMAAALLQRYGDRLCSLLKDGKTRGTLDADLDVDAAATAFIGTIQGLVMQSLLTGDPKQIGRNAPGVFAIYLRGIGAAP